MLTIATALLCLKMENELVSFSRMGGELVSFSRMIRHFEGRDCVNINSYRVKTPKEGLGENDIRLIVSEMDSRARDVSTEEEVIVSLMQFCSESAERLFMKLLVDRNVERLCLFFDWEDFYVHPNEYFRLIASSTSFQFLHIRASKNPSVKKGLVDWVSSMRLRRLWLDGMWSFVPKITSLLTPTISVLELTNCFGLSSDNSVHELVRSLWGGSGRQLHTLNLSRNSFQDLSFIPSLFGACRRLTRLDLTRSDIKDVSGRPQLFCIEAYDHSFLKWIDVSDTKYSSINAAIRVFLKNSPEKAAIKRMLAFVSRRISRVSTKSAMRRLFFDADRMLWHFLV